MVFELKKRAPNDPVPMAQPIDLGEDPWPALSEMLFSDRWPDGSVRVPSTLTLFTGDGAIKGCLNDKDSELTAWASGSSLQGLLDALEAGLQGDCLDWRKAGKRTNKRK